MSEYGRSAADAAYDAAAQQPPVKLPHRPSAIETVPALTQCEADKVWRDRFGWRVWWDWTVNWWVTQADSGAGSDKPRRVGSELERRGPFTAVS